jgi:hypothetical protein
LQGLLFLGIALFSLKWEFHGSRDKPFITPTGEVYWTIKAFFEASPPWHVGEKLVEAAFFGAVGFYLWLTGEVVRWHGQGRRYSPVTFLAVMSGFLTVFTAKFAYHSGDPSGYYPPFETGSLSVVYAFFGLLTLYYLVIGEVRFWRRKAELPDPPEPTMPVRSR